MIDSASKSQQLIENLYTAVMVFDEQLCLNCINTAGENLFSTTYRMLAGHNAREVFPDSIHLVNNIQRSLDTRQTFREQGVELILPNATSITVDCMFTPLLEGKICREVIVELIDIRSLSRVMKEENLAAFHDAARESLHGMAHEIKNPLGGLRGAAQLLERELNGSELTEYTHIIISEADRLRKLIDRMLTPNGKLNISMVNIHEILEYVQNLLEAESGIHLRIERDYDPSLPDLEADKEQLIQAILNIFRNAVQAIPGDGQIWLNTRIKRKCTIRQKFYKLAMLIEIIDDGPGVPAGIEKGLFYPMVTGRAEGTGLGLSIAQSLIQSHEGIIEHERKDDTTVFRILLPLRSRDD